jgi:hypothetical protein
MKRTSIKAMMLLIIIITSCSTTKQLPKEVSQNAKSINSVNDQALVYIFRVSSLGALVSLRVDLNNHFLASFYPKKFYLCALEPGKYVFTGHGENSDDIIVNLEKGKKYYIEVIPQMGFSSARCKLKLLDSVKGEKDIEHCKLIGMNQSAQKLLNYTPTPK